MRGDVEEDGGEVEGPPGPTRAGAAPAGAPSPGTCRRIRREGDREREEGEGEMEVRGKRGRAEFEGFFEKKILRGDLDCGLIRLKIECFFAKRPRLARYGTSARSIEWPRKADDVATLAGQLLDLGFI